LETIHRLKTGALLTAAVRCGALLGGGSRQEVNLVTAFGEKFGLAFQITDDILDVEGDSQEMGKTAGADARKHKATYPGLLGLEQAKAWARKLVEGAVADLEPLGERAAPLQELARYLLVRRT